MLVFMFKFYLCFYLNYFLLKVFLVKIVSDTFKSNTKETLISKSTKIHLYFLKKLFINYKINAGLFWNISLIDSLFLRLVTKFSRLFSINSYVKLCCLLKPYTRCIDYYY